MTDPRKNFFPRTLRGILASIGKALFLALAVLFAAGAAMAEPRKNGVPSGLGRSVVSVEVSRKEYQYYQPWSTRTKKVKKVGVVIGDRQVLVTAEDLSDNTLVRLQKGGRGQWWIGKVLWIDYHTDLALVTAADADFWRDLKPVALKGLAHQGQPLQIVRWREGTLESRQAEFTQFSVREAQLSPLDEVTLEVGSEIQGCGWGEPIVSDSHVIGLIRAQEGRTCLGIPASFIREVVDAHNAGSYRGMGYFHFYWEPAENPATLARLKVPAPASGVLVIQVPDRPDGGPKVLKREDVILRIDGFELDIQGDYNDPEYGHLNLESLATLHKWAGDDVKMQIWRDGRQMDVTYRLPRYEYTNSLVPYAIFDQEPEYLIIGGLVFQPLSIPYLQSWGADWRQRAPFRLNYYNNEPPTKDRSSLVLLSQVLPDPYNIGYQEVNYLAVDKVNGQRISRLSDLKAALQKPVNGYHIIDFMPGDSLQRLVLAAGDAEEEATRRVLKRYGITESSRLASAVRSN